MSRRTLVAMLHRLDQLPPVDPDRDRRAFERRLDLEWRIIRALERGGHFALVGNLDTSSR